MRTHRMQKLGMIAVCVFMLGAAGASQEKPNAAPQPVATADAGTSPPLLRVQITVARYQGEKKISSAPYTLLMNADGQRGGLRMGAQVPVPVAPGGTDRPAQTVQYRDIGTSIDCSARPTANGMYQMELSIEDSSDGCRRVSGRNGQKRRAHRSGSFGRVTGSPRVKDSSRNSSAPRIGRAAT